MVFEVTDAGALAFGIIIGWYVYYVNRYRKGDVQFSDLTTLIGVIGGGGILALFKTPVLFGWYGIGLFVGFFGYFAVLVGLVKKSSSFNADWFLDGRRRNPPDGFGYGADAGTTVHPMNAAVTGFPASPVSTSTQNFYLGTGVGGGATASSAAVVATLASTADRIKGICARLLPDHADDCSGFARVVCAELGAALVGDANAIVDFLAPENGWTVIGDDATAGARAAEAAKTMLVIGAKKAEGNGHVVVVVAGDLQAGKYPHAYWGKLRDPSNAGYDKTVNWAWDTASRDSVKYASRAV